MTDMIDTEKHLSIFLGEPLSIPEGFLWTELYLLEDSLLQFVNNAEKGDYVASGLANTYNLDNILTSDFQYQVFHKSGSDWEYADDVYIAIEVHGGGDIRRNYDETRLYKVSGLGPEFFSFYC